MSTRALLTSLVLVFASCASRPVLPLPVPCPPPAVETEGWQQIDEDAFSFRIPPAFQEQNIQPIDSHAREWRAGRDRISFDFGWHSAKLLPQGEEVGYAACTEEVDGRLARIVTYWHPHLGYAAGAHWTVHEERPAERFEDMRMGVYLTIHVTSPERARLDTLRAVLWTTTFSDRGP